MKLTAIQIRNLTLAGFYSFLFFFTFAITYVMSTILKKNNVKVTIPNPISQNNPSPTSIPTPKPENIYSVLLIGYGGAGHDGGGLADVIMLVVTNFDTKKTTLLSIPRDTWTDNQKINNIFATSGPNGLKNAVNKVTGIMPDYFVSIDFSSFTRAIDTLNGVDVNVPAGFDDYFYPIKGLEDDSCGKNPDEIKAIHATMSGYFLEQQFTCRYEHLHFDKGITHMDGTTALKFVRSRHSDQNGGDFARSARQQALLIAVKNKALSLGALKNAVSFFNQFKNIVKTDIDENIIKFIEPLIGNPDIYTQKSVNLSTDNVYNDIVTQTGAYALIPKAGNENWNEIHDFVQNQLK